MTTLNDNIVGVCYLISVACKVGQQVWLGAGCSLLASILLGLVTAKEYKKQCVFVSLKLI